MTIIITIADLAVLVCASFYTPFEIQWVGLVVTGLYAVVYTVMLLRLGKLASALQDARI